MSGRQNGSMNIERQKNFQQVCVWPLTIVGKNRIKEFENFMNDNFGIRVQYLEEIFTNLDKDGNRRGKRSDLFFSVHTDDILKFTGPRLLYDIQWIEDVLTKENYKIYPKRVFEYKSW